MTTTPGRCPVSVEGSAASGELGGVVADQIRRASGDHAGTGERLDTTITVGDLMDGLDGLLVDVPVRLSVLDDVIDIEAVVWIGEDGTMTAVPGQAVEVRIIGAEVVG